LVALSVSIREFRTDGSIPEDFAGGRPMTPKSFHTLFAQAKMPFTIHSHMLRHACGYAWRG
jgi:hypothetical protein